MDIERIVGIVTSDGEMVLEVHEHLFERKHERALDIGDVIDALQKPLNITQIKTNLHGEQSKQYIGRNATVVFNPVSKKAVTCWPTSAQRRNRYSKGSD
jgi:hypothetical protein